MNTYMNAAFIFMAMTANTGLLAASTTSLKCTQGELPYQETLTIELTDNSLRVSRSPNTCDLYREDLSEVKSKSLKFISRHATCWDIYATGSNGEMSNLYSVEAPLLDGKLDLSRPFVFDIEFHGDLGGSSTWSNLKVHCQRVTEL